MKITITFDDGKIVELPSDNEIVHTINAKYPEMGMMVAMEELDELAIALRVSVMVIRISWIILQRKLWIPVQ